MTFEEKRSELIKSNLRSLWFAVSVVAICLVGMIFFIPHSPVKYSLYLLIVFVIYIWINRFYFSPTIDCENCGIDLSGALGSLSKDGVIRYCPYCGMSI